jgi:hypothetical protein
VPGSASTLPFAISDTGFVTGVYWNAPVVGVPTGNENWAFVRYANGLYASFRVPEGSNTEPFSINDLGDVTGIWTTALCGPTGDC